MLGCSESTPHPVAPDMSAGHSAHGGGTQVQGSKAEQGFIDGWFDGNDVNLHYTKLYTFCAELLDERSTDECAIGADAEVSSPAGRANPNDLRDRRGTGFSRIRRRWHVVPGNPSPTESPGNDPRLTRGGPRCNQRPRGAAQPDSPG